MRVTPWKSIRDGPPKIKTSPESRITFSAFVSSLSLP
jgi:hypothetical protein